MLGRVSGALSSVADVIAPPVTRIVDFQYHWKLVQNFYMTERSHVNVHVDNTKIPFHLDQMLQFIVDEETESPDEIGPCLKELIDPKLEIAFCLTSLAEADRPPGLRGTVLVWYNSLLRRVQSIPIQEPPLYRPIQKLLISCNENRASPNEKEEVELLLTLCGLVRKQPDLAKLFLSSNYKKDTSSSLLKHSVRELPIKNKLFEFDYVPNPLKHVCLVTQPKSDKKSDNECPSSNCSESASVSDSSDVEDRFLLMDLLLTYLGSADNHIVLRACEGIMIVTSLPDDHIANLIANSSSVCAYLIDKLIDKYKALPEDTDPCDIDQLNITWGFASQEFADKCVKSVGLRETTSFLCWLDYCDTLAKECHVTISLQLAKSLRWHFFVAELELGLQNMDNSVLVTTVIGKCLKAIDSPDFLNEICQWLVGDCTNVTIRPPNPILQKLIDNCLEGETEICLETLRLFEVMIEKASEHILYCLILAFLENRGYHAHIRSQQYNEEDERERLNGQSLRQERESNRQIIKKIFDGHTDGTNLHTTDGIVGTNVNSPSQIPNIHHAINSFLLLLPRDLLSDPNGLGYEQYMQDAHRQYLHWVEATVGFIWPTIATWPDPSTSSTQSCDSRPEADLYNSPCPRTENRKVNTEKQISENKTSNQNILESNIIELPEKPMILNEVYNKLPKCESPDFSFTFHQNLVLNRRDRCSLSEMAEEDEISFNEGPFLRMLYKLLLNMPSQSYHVNLQLTSIISKLALIPHPNLHEYILNPSLPTGKNVNTVFKSLQKLSKVFMTQIPKVKKFNAIIEETRQRLLGDDSIDDGERCEPLFESLIVVEEFCKELAAIFFVKYHHSTG